LFSVTMLAVIACRGEPPQKQPHDPPPPPRPLAERPVLDEKLAATCVVTYSCGLSHPGLGTSLTATSVDLATCTRTTRSESGPYVDAEPLSPAPRSAPLAPRPAPPPPSPPPGSLPADQCRHVLALVMAITPSDARAAQESAHVDSTACDLEVACPPNNASKLRIQRQTTSGKSRVEELIRSL
jgi:hypothetical protein